MYGTLISSVTVGAGGASSIDFTSIPGTYTDLCLVYTGAQSAIVSFNSDTANNYSEKYLRGTGAAVQTGGSTGQAFITLGLQSDATDIVSSQMIIPNYAGSSAKTASVEGIGERNAASTLYQVLVAGKWSGTAAISTLKIDFFGSTFPQYSTASIYGLLKGSGGATVS